MLRGDVDLQPSHLQSISNKDEVVRLFTMLGYHTDARLTQTTEAMGLTADGLRHEILHIELIANEENGGGAK